MKNKMLLATLLLVSVAFALALSWTSVSAQSPVNTNPGSAVYMDNQTHSVPPNTTLWYKFDYSADQLPVELTLFSGVPQQMQFNVYTPDQIGADFSVGNPIGRGLPPGNSDNLLWKSVFLGAGTFYVEVINPTSIARTFLISITGGGYTPRVQPPAPTPVPPRTVAAPSPTTNVFQTIFVPAIATLRAPAPSAAVSAPTPTSVPTAINTPTATSATATAAPPPIIIVVVTATPMSTAVTVPSPTTVPTPVNDWWTSSLYVVNGRTYTIPGNTERWFVFDYAGDRSKVEIRIPGGNEKKLQFRLFTTDQIQRYTVDGTPTGMGTAPIVNCDTGRCVSNDLVWAGDFMMNGTYFIQVTNFDPTPKNYEISVIGSGVTLGR